MLLFRRTTIEGYYDGRKPNCVVCIGELVLFALLPIVLLSCNGAGGNPACKTSMTPAIDSNPRRAKSSARKPFYQDLRYVPSTEQSVASSVRLIPWVSARLPVRKIAYKSNGKIQSLLLILWKWMLSRCCCCGGGAGQYLACRTSDPGGQSGSTSMINRLPLFV